MAGPSIGPFISAWLILVMPWRAVYGVLAALYGLSWLTIIILGDETLYDRRSPLAKKRGFFAGVKLLVGITGAQTGGRPRLVDVLRHMMNIQFQPHVFLISVVFVTIYWMWIIGIVTTITEVLAPPPYSFDGQAIALSYIGPIIGSILGQVWGHWFNDWLCARYVRSHEGLYVLENRLWGLYPPTFVAFASLVLFGQAWQRSLHWAALIIAWSGTSFGLVAVSTTVEAYCLDSFPNHGSLVAGIINMWRSVPYTRRISGFGRLPADVLQNNRRLLRQLFSAFVGGCSWTRGIFWYSGSDSGSCFYRQHRRCPGVRREMEGSAPTSKGRELKVTLLVLLYAKLSHPNTSPSECLVPQISHTPATSPP